MAPATLNLPATDDERAMPLVPPETMVARFAALMAEPGGDTAHALRSAPAPAPEPDRPPCRVEIPQALALRVAGGPLAGMLLRVFWQDARLEVRFVTADPALARRLDGQGGELSSALGRALGVAVRVGVERDGAA